MRWTILKKTEKKSENQTGSPYDKQGPFTTAEVIERIKNQEINSFSDLIWKAGMSKWELLSEVEEFKTFFKKSKDSEFSTGHSVSLTDDSGHDATVVMTEEELRAITVTATLTQLKNKEKKEAKKVEAVKEVIKEVSKREQNSQSPSTAPTSQWPKQNNQRLNAKKNTRKKTNFKLIAAIAVCFFLVLITTISIKSRKPHIEKIVLSSSSSISNSNPNIKQNLSERQNPVVIKPSSPSVVSIQNEKNDRGYEEIPTVPRNWESREKTIKNLQTSNAKTFRESGGPVRFAIPSVLKLGSKLVVLSSLKKGENFTIKMSGRSGEIIDLPGFEKKVQWQASGDGEDLIPLSLFKAPTGSYKLTLSDGHIVSEKKVFVGEKDAIFNEKIKNIKKTLSFFQQQEKKKLFQLANLYGQKGDELLKLSANFSSNQKILKKQISDWKSKFYKLNSQEMKSFSSGNYQLAFAEEWKTLVDIHTQWVELVEASEQQRQLASLPISIKSLLTQTENFKKRAAKLTVW
jgi:hypothetical protein